jgi:octaheme c-type cytochrome (tetrathionate reductase family)
MPADGVDLVAAAQSVGPSTRRNCGVCHFDGGGGTGVKHGDLDESLYEPSRELDVHMGGMDFTCIECHTTSDHVISGAGHSSMAENTNHVACTDCHDSEGHDKSILNRHSRHVACETCHIPTFAREEPTKIWWDWSTAGSDKDAGTDEFGKETYNKKKGDFRWAKNVVPTYRWHDGTALYYRKGDKIVASEALQLNRLQGNISEPEAKIAPFKVMRGRQPYDPENMMLIVPNLYGKDGYWNTFDWVTASDIGMKAAGLPFSGKVDFVMTEMYWPINHMVAPKEQALSCTSCHMGGERRINWNALGYPDDPMKTGGRKKLGLLKQTTAE